MASMHKIADHITLGLIVAALLIGAAMLMPIETDYTILGDPAFAIVFSSQRRSSGMVLAISIVRHDPRADLKRGPEA